MVNTNRDPAARYETLKQFLPFFIKQIQKLIHTSVPGIVTAYDAESKRCRAQIALNLVLKDGNTMARPVIIDVPVLHPAGGGYVVHLPVTEGDAVMLVFSERGLDNFKQTFEVADPPLDVFLEERDAVALPGFGALDVSPQTTTGLSIQTEDGTDFITIDEGDITVQVADGDVNINVPAGKQVNIGGPGGQELATKQFVEMWHNRHIHQSPAGPTAIPTILSPLTEGQDITDKAKAE